MDERLRAWAPELAVGGGVLVLAVGEATASTTVIASTDELLLVGAATAAAAATFRRRPAAGLAVAWFLALLHLVQDVPPMFVELAFVVVMFGAARWGGPSTVAAAGVSIPAVPALGVLTLLGQGPDAFAQSDLGAGVSELYFSSSTGGFATTLALVATAPAAPWLAGLAVRYADRARASRASQEEAEEQAAAAQRVSEQSLEIARLRDEQARLARDVHDVVGHSLAVILAQAESAQFLPDDDPARLKQTMATIATSARSSLQDVRQVLSAPDGGGVQAQPLDRLVDGVRAGGHEVVLRELGTPRPLPPDLEVTAYRVLQEMLTNAVRHGSRDEPVFVERHWPDEELSDELRVEVRNVASGPGGQDVPTAGTGQGLDGMRQRLAAVGGRLDVRRRAEDEGETFTATAWVPLGPR